MGDVFIRAVKDVKEMLVSDDGDTLCIGSTLEPEHEEALSLFLRVNLDVFTWKPSDMPGIPKEVTEHKLNIKSSAKPVKQKLRHFDGDKCEAIQEEIKKLLAAGVIREVLHPEWLANPVLVKKKNDKWRMCVSTPVSTKRARRIHSLCHK
jgi:hypothetical protein